MNIFHSATVLAVAGTLTIIGAHAQDAPGARAAVNMIGRQSQNEGMLVVPARGGVTIDGDLQEWDWSGRVMVFADKSIRDRYSVEAAAMWDKDNLYLAARWRDPSPMFSVVDPEFNPNEGWKSDAWQIRLKTDKVAHLTTWLYTPKEMPVMHVSYARAGEGGFALFSGKGPELGRGAAMAYRKSPDGAGFIQEIRVPWALIYDKAPALQPGTTFRLGLDFQWGDPTGGRSTPQHQYRDNMQPGVTNREFFWEKSEVWGDARLVAENNGPLRQYIEAGALLPGTIPVRAVIPAGAKRFTLAINDAQGKRIRNLAGDFTPEDYSVGFSGAQRTVQVMWDGLDDAGKIAAPGHYQVVGLAHGGLSAQFDSVFYNPGSPAWEVKDGSGGWGADHTPPSGAVRAGDWIVLGWHFAEGGSGIIGIGPDSKKKWGESRGALALAADNNHVYAISSGWHANGNLIRLDKSTGAYRPFVLNGKERPFELSMAEIFGADFAAPQNIAAEVSKTGGISLRISGTVTALASSGKQLGMALWDEKTNRGRLALLDSTTAQPLKTWDAPHITGLAWDVTNAVPRLFAVAGGKVHRVETASGRFSPLVMPGLGVAAALTVDARGNLVIADSGPDSDVKIYAPNGKLLGTAGRKGGRPLRGRFDEQAMMRVNSVAVDSKGHIWTTEKWDSPRRVSVWNASTGRLVRDYIGNTSYAGTGAYLHDSNPTLGYVGPVEMKIDRSSGAFKVTRILWVPDESRGEAFPLWPQSPHWFTNPSFISSAASGQMRRYLFFYDRYNVVYMERGDAWQPVAALLHVRDLPKMLREGAFKNDSDDDGLIWNDLDGDARVTRAESTLVTGGLPLGRTMTDWGKRLGSDLSVWSNTPNDGPLVRFLPTRFTRDGAPIYGLESMTKLPLNDTGDLVPVAEENLLLNLSFKGFPNTTSGMMGVDTRTGSVLWTYPNIYPSVHGSHRAPMPKPGVLVGPLKITGVAKVPNAGRVFGLRGNLGQDYFLTTDGLFIGALFQDSRLPSDALPADPALLRGRPLEDFGEGGEPFSGWFGRQADAKIRMTTSLARQAAFAVEIKGLDSVRRFNGPTLALSATQLAQAERDSAARRAATEEARTYTIRRFTAAPTINGDAVEWATVPGMALQKEGAPEKGIAKIGYDDKNLYVFYEIEDATPLRNVGKDFTRLFKTGDAVDLQFGPAHSHDRSEPAESDVRVVFSTLSGGPIAVLMKPTDVGAPAGSDVLYTSPVAPRRFDRVQILAGAQVAVQTEANRYRVEAAVPLHVLGLQAQTGKALRGDAGFISSDAQGLFNVARTYWSNQNTNLVNDLPQEAWLYPKEWGDWKLE